MRRGGSGSWRGCGCRCRCGGRGRWRREQVVKTSPEKDARGKPTNCRTQHTQQWYGTAVQGHWYLTGKSSRTSYSYRRKRGEGNWWWVMDDGRREVMTTAGYQSMAAEIQSSNNQFLRRYRTVLYDSFQPKMEMRAAKTGAVAGWPGGNQRTSSETVGAQGEEIAVLLSAAVCTGLYMQLVSVWTRSSVYLLRWVSTSLRLGGYN